MLVTEACNLVRHFWRTIFKMKIDKAIEPKIYLYVLQWYQSLSEVSFELGMYSGLSNKRKVWNNRTGQEILKYLINAQDEIIAQGRKFPKIAYFVLLDDILFLNCWIFKIVFCCIVAWIQPDISGCQQDFLIVWKWNQLRTF